MMKLDSDGLPDKLEMAKKRDKKIDITPVAISKLPHIDYKGLDGKQNQALFSLAQTVLQIAMTENNSNEVAVTCSLDNENIEDVIGISFGDEHGVDVCSDTVSYHLIVSSTNCAVVVLHNHPSTQTLSMEDLMFFLSYPTVRLMIVVTNQGNIHYVCKDDDFSYENARNLFNETCEELNEKSTWKEIYMAGLSFLARCSEVGLYYR